MAVENILSDFLLWGRQYGRKDTGEVRRAADAAIFIALCSWVVITVLCLLFVKRYFVWQSGRDGVIAKYGIQYLAVCMLFSLGQWVFDRFVIASGRIAQQAGKCGWDLRLRIFRVTIGSMVLEERLQADTGRKV